MFPINVLFIHVLFSGLCAGLGEATEKNTEIGKIRKISGDALRERTTRRSNLFVSDDPGIVALRSQSDSAYPR